MKAAPKTPKAKRQEEQAEREKNRQMDIEKNFVKINLKKLLFNKSFC